MFPAVFCKTYVSEGDNNQTFSHFSPPLLDPLTVF